MIDLHTHTTASDGSESPAELIRLAQRAGIRALAITDHDTFAGIDAALELEETTSLELVRGIELSAKGSLHLLAYFFKEPGTEFRSWLKHLVDTRRQRNASMAERLQSMGVEISLEEAEQLGSVITGRVHFARLLITKGYARTYHDAFDRYIGETAPAYVERADPSPQMICERVRAAGGIVSLAHPGRFRRTSYAAEPERRSNYLKALVEGGLEAIEVWHSDHNPEEVRLYSRLAGEFGLLPTAGSDFHGAPKPDIQVGTGRHGNLAVGLETLENLRRHVTNR